MGGTRKLRSAGSVLSAGREGKGKCRELSCRGGMVAYLSNGIICNSPTMGYRG